MAITTGILSQLRPSGTSGDQFNLRAANIFHFKTTTTQGAAPASGECSVASGILTVRNDNIVKLDVGMIISVRFGGFQGTFPTSVKVLGANGATIGDAALETSTINNNNLSELGWYVLIYDGASFKNINHTFTSSTSGSDNDLPTLGVVRSLLSNRWKVEVCPAVAAQIPAGAVYYDGTTTITGTMAASSATAYIIYLVRHNHTDSTTATDKDIYDEWITVNDSSWEKLGNTDVDLSGIITNIADHSYVKPTGSITGSANLASGTAASAGAHTHSVSGTNSAAVTTGYQNTSGVTITATANTNGNYTPAGSVTGKVTVSGTAASVDNHNHTITATGDVTTDGEKNSATPTNAVITAVSGKSHSHSVSVSDHTYTPAGSVTGTMDVSGSAADAGSHVHKVTATGNILNTADVNTEKTNQVVKTVSGKNHTHTTSVTGATYTPAGSLSLETSTATGRVGVLTAVTANGHTHSYTPSGTISVGSGTANYTPGGSVTSGNTDGVSVVTSLTNGAHKHSLQLGDTGSGTTDVVTDVTHTNATYSAVSGLAKITNWDTGTASTIGGTSTAFTDVSVGSASDWSQGSASSYSVSGEVLTMTASTTPSLTITSKDIKSGATTNYISAITGSNSTTPTLTYTSNTSVNSITGTGGVTVTKKAISVVSETVGANTTKLGFSGTGVQLVFGGTSSDTGSSSESLTPTTRYVAFTGTQDTITPTVSITSSGSDCINATHAGLSFSGNQVETTPDGNHSHTVSGTASITDSKKLTFGGTQATLTHTASSGDASDCVTSTTSYLKFTGSPTSTGLAGGHSHSVSGTGSTDATNAMSFSGTKVQLSGTMADHTHTIAKEDISISGTATSDGEHTHSVSGTIAGSNFTVSTTTDTLTHTKKS